MECTKNMIAVKKSQIFAIQICIYLYLTSLWLSDFTDRKTSLGKPCKSTWWMLKVRKRLNRSQFLTLKTIKNASQSDGMKNNYLSQFFWNRFGWRPLIFWNIRESKNLDSFLSVLPSISFCSQGEQTCGSRIAYFSSFELRFSLSLTDLVVRESLG